MSKSELRWPSQLLLKLLPSFSAVLIFTLLS